MPKAKQPRVHRPAEKVIPYFRLPNAVFTSILDKRYKASTLKVLLYAMRADSGFLKRITLTLGGVRTGTGCGKEAISEGLKQLVNDGFLIKLNARSDYRLGNIFNINNSDDEAANGTDTDADGQVPVSNPLDQAAYADQLFAIWKEVKDPDEDEPDGEARKRAESWASKRIKANGEPLREFRMAAEFFVEHGHETKDKDGNYRDQATYGFKGFMKICSMFFTHATARSVPSGDYSVVDLGPSEAIFNDDKSSGFTRESLPIGITDRSNINASFIIDKDEDGSFSYRQGEITSPEELASIYEHAFELVGVPVAILCDKKAMTKCAEDYSGFLKGAHVGQVVRLIKYAKWLSTTEGQKDYFEKHQFVYHTARTLFGDAWALIKKADKAEAQWKEEERRKIESGERRNEHLNSIRMSLSYIANDYTNFGFGREQNRDLLERGAQCLERDYGRPGVGTLPQDIVDGLRCLSTLGALDIPECLSDAFGMDLWVPTFEWVTDDSLKARLNRAWNETESAKVEAIMANFRSNSPGFNYSASSASTTEPLQSPPQQHDVD